MRGVRTTRFNNAYSLLLIVSDLKVPEELVSLALKKASRDFLLSIADCFVNLCQGTFPVPPKFKKFLKRNKRFILFAIKASENEEDARADYRKLRRYLARKRNVKILRSIFHSILPYIKASLRDESVDRGEEILPHRGERSAAVDGKEDRADPAAAAAGEAGVGTGDPVSDR